MLSNFLLTGIRNIKKNRLVSLLNIAGLSLGIACFLVILVFVEFTQQVDSFHKDRDRISLITYQTGNNGGISTWAQSPAALGPALIKDLPQVEQMVRLKRERAIIQVNEQEAFFELITFCDPEFFSMFSFILDRGNPQSLYAPSQIIISERMALKYFAKRDPVGEVMQVQFSNGRRTSFTIGGVAAAFPKKRSFEFDLLMNYSLLKECMPEPESWNAFADATFIKTVNRNDMGTVIRQSGRYLETYNAANPDLKIQAFSYAPLETLSLNSYRIRGSFVRGWGPPAGRIALLLIGFMLITISCMNYINAAIGLGARRLTEIGVRKVFGGTRRHVIYQFMTENLLVNLLALILGILIAVLFLLPQFERLLDIGLYFDPGNLSIWLFLAGILLLTTLLSGAYPSFYIARYHTIYILRGSNKFGSRNLLSKFALSLQFILAFIYIVASLLFIANGRYLRSRDCGYNQNDLLTITPADKSSYSYFRDQLNNMPDIKAVSGAREHIGFSSTVSHIRLNNVENSIKVITLGVDSTYMHTLEAGVLAGIPFDRSINSGINTVIINEALARSMSLKAPIGEPLRIGDQVYFVSAVSKNFLFNDFQRLPEPVVIMQVPPEQCVRLVIRTAKGKAGKVYSSLQDKWRAVTPDVPFEGAYQEEAFQFYFNMLAGHNKIMVFSALLAVIISCIGLFNLVYLNVSSKQRDYSIMKILGAGALTLVRKVSGIYTGSLIIAVIIGFPLSMYITRMMFGIVYKEHVPVTWLYPLWGFLLLAPVYMLTVLWLVRKIVRHDPAKSLRNE